MTNKELVARFREILTLRWSPVAVKLLKDGEAVPAGVMEPAVPLRHCQSINLARRGNGLYMPPSRHACPDGAAIMGLIPMAPKLRSGELYLLFKKLPNIECAQKMIASRPEFDAGTYSASVIAPLEAAEFEPDVVIFTLYPEQMMWLCCASSYGSGERHIFHTSGYNSTCADLTVQVMKSQKMNISFGCYGARAITDLNDFEAYLSVPFKQMESLAESLQKLSLKSIPEARNKIYMPPVIRSSSAVSAATGAYRVTITVDDSRCNGCGLCEAFCPEEVMRVKSNSAGNGSIAFASTDKKCCACYTCVGQCPQKAIRIEVNQEEILD